MGPTCRIISMTFVLALPAAAAATAMEISRDHLPVRSAALPAPPHPRLIDPHPYIHCAIAFPAVVDRGGSPCGARDSGRHLCSMTTFVQNLCSQFLLCRKIH